MRKALDENGICASPNDVSGYDKAKYMKDGLNYAYKDAAGNEYIYQNKRRIPLPLQVGDEC
ncbi:MAG: hypothetical protein ACI4EH_11495, partial [Oliverpabstia sp.]